MTDAAIQIRSVSKSFGNKQILRNINLDVEKGKTVVTLGKSGTGKSVMLKCIVGLMKPDAGKINVLGSEVTGIGYEKLQELRKKIGFIFQSGALYDSMSVRQNLEFPLVRHQKLSRDEISHKIESVLRDVDLADAIDKMPSELSGGMRKRIGVARTIIMNPEIMLWDEPTTGLDPATTKGISNLIRSMQEKYNVTSIVVTHDMICTKIVADKIVVLKEGEYTVPAGYNELAASDDGFIRSFFI
jgi:phospholipid/cholesterol/gamma-HCH transport system ATP-binding protein